MDRVAIAALLAIGLAFLPFASVHGQAPPAPKTAATPTAESPASKPAASPKRRVRSQADARGCLDFETNFEIIACAEKYR